MALLEFVADLDLAPIPGKTYFNTTREFREEFIYFLMLDRFHDDTDRSATPKAGRSLGVTTPDGSTGGVSGA